MDFINNAELTEDYSKLIDDYNRSAILNKTTLHKIGEAIGVRYLLYVKLLEQVRTQGLTRGALTGDLVKTTGKRVNLFGQVWDCTLGDVVWEGTGDVFVESGEMTYVAQTMDELVAIASRSFLSNLPGVQIQKPE
jgi:methyl coenzyme M reductase beta subunit